MERLAGFSTKDQVLSLVPGSASTECVTDGVAQGIY